MPWVNPKVAEIVAKQPGVKAAVREVRDKAAGIARAEFASHDRPGRHEITTEDDRVDALVVFEGPAPLSVEFGHWAGEGVNRRYVEGLHIFDKMTSQMEAEGRL